MNNPIMEKWGEILDFLKTEYGITLMSFNTWLKDLKVYSINGNKVTIVADSNKIVNPSFLINRYGTYIKNAIEETIGEEIELEIVSDKQIEQNVSVPQNKIPDRPNLNTQGISLNPLYTFDNFVVSSNNSFVHATALTVAEAPGQYYNPLYIYGDPGLGKTHLMQSIAHYILETSPSLHVMYVTSEVFMNELIDAIRQGGVETSAGFREKYRNIDVLLIDDIQFIIGKERTQEEFFHTFNYLYESHKQIVISSDKPPKDFTTLDERFKSRFEWGLTVDLKAPDFETKMAILKKKIEIKQNEDRINMNISDEVLTYIAENITTNIRSLEGALTKIIALSRIKRVPVDLTLAQEALRDIITPDQKKVITPSTIVDIVAEHFEISTDNILSNKRDEYIAIPRQIAMYLSRKNTSLSTEAIGKFFHRDHSTVLYGIKSIEKKIGTDSDISEKVNIITKKLNL